MLRLGVCLGLSGGMVGGCGWCERRISFIQDDLICTCWGPSPLTMLGGGGEATKVGSPVLEILALWSTSEGKCEDDAYWLE